MPAKRSNAVETANPRESKRTRPSNSSEDAAPTEITTDASGDGGGSIANLLHSSDDAPSSLPEPATTSKEATPINASVEASGSKDGPSSSSPNPDDPDYVVPPTALNRQIIRALRGLDRVPSHLPHPDKSDLPPNFRTYITESLQTRLKLLIHYVNAAVHIYSIGALPQVTHWGAMSGGADDLSSYLTVNGIPVKVWFPAEVKVPWFFNKNGGVLNLRSINPPEKKGIWAAKWLASKDTPEDEVMEFEEVYDARKKLRAKRDMKRLEVNILKPNDIVLVEAVIRRFTPRDDDKSKAFTSKGWSTWRTNFELTSITDELTLVVDMLQSIQYSLIPSHIHQFCTRQPLHGDCTHTLFCSSF
ncbi:hypothetical protein NLI96_g10638 [Meripilus lineatus]|uniref:Uncharacterized protein n=1 Tax=Meripilus lineatus TaxID=2056292 RepID=A0AAD5YBS3_9APHY|nr:hypothetical protein NLI96_g10638 [Physisporinus lineatus]